jgi:hypothetical protein
MLTEAASLTGGSRFSYAPSDLHLMRMLRDLAPLKLDSQPHNLEKRINVRCRIRILHQAPALRIRHPTRVTAIAIVIRAQLGNPRKANLRESQRSLLAGPRKLTKPHDREMLIVMTKT